MRPIHEPWMPAWPQAGARAPVSSSDVERHLARSLQSEIGAEIGTEIGAATPGLKVQAYAGGDKVCDLALGDTYPFYDLASLTKILFTTVAAMAAFEEGRWSLDTRVQALWPTFPAPACRLSHLLSHSGGAVWWHPFYQDPALAEAADASLLRRRLRTATETLAWGEPGPCVYSDVGMIAFGFCLEAMYAASLPKIWDKVRDRLGAATGLAFHPGNRSPQDASLYAPTEVCPWRGRRLQGEVHDENAWSFGGVSTHAGLFGGIDDVAAFGLALRAAMRGESGAGLSSPATMRLFGQRATAESGPNWGLGFRKPAREAPSCGRHFSQNSLGHEGFTGTSLWFDPDRDLLVAILSNRVYYGRDNAAFRLLRPRIHDLIVTQLFP